MYLLKLSIQIPYKLAGTAGNAHANGNLYGQGVRFPRRTYTPSSNGIACPCLH